MVTPDESYSRAKNDYIAQNPPASRTKAWIGAGLGTLLCPIIGTIIGAIIGHNQESEALKEHQRKAENAGAQSAFNTARGNGLKGEDLASHAEKAKKAEIIATKPKSNKTAWGFLIGTLVAFCAGALALLGPVGWAIAAIVGIAAPFVGAAIGYHSAKKEDEAIKQKANSESLAVRNQYLAQGNTPQHSLIPTTGNNVGITTQQEPKKSQVIQLQEERAKRENQTGNSISK